MNEYYVLANILVEANSEEEAESKVDIILFEREEFLTHGIEGVEEWFAVADREEWSSE